MTDDAQGTEAVTNFDSLTRPFDADHIEWRVRKSGTKQNGQPWARVVPYPDARAVMDRLDRACGPQNWRDEYREGPAGGVLCGISIRCNGEWVTKWDGAGNTDIEQVKGGLTDSFKRAAVKWNVGGVRALYRLGDHWAAFREDGRYRDRIDGDYYEWDPPDVDLSDVSDGGSSTNGKPTLPDVVEENLKELSGLNAERADKARSWAESAIRSGTSVEDITDKVDRAITDEKGEEGAEYCDQRLEVESWFHATYGDEADTKLRLCLSRHPLIQADGEPGRVSVEQWDALLGQIMEHGTEMVESPREALS